MKVSHKRPVVTDRPSVRTALVEAMESRLLLSFVLYNDDNGGAQANADAGGGTEQTVTMNPAHAESSFNRAAEGTYYAAFMASAMANASNEAAAQQLTFHVDATESDPAVSGHSSDASAGSVSALYFNLTTAATVQIDGTVTGVGGGSSSIVFDGFNANATVSSENADGVHLVLHMSAGNYEVGIHALAPSGNAAASASADLTLTLDAAAPQAPKITSANAITFQRGQFAQFTVTTSGDPTPGLQETAILPDGVTFGDNGDGTGTLSGIPSTSDATGTYRLILTAANGTSPDANQFFALKIAGASLPTGQPTKITSSGKFKFQYGVAAAVEVRTTGNPVAALSIAGNLPTGLSFQDHGDGSGSFFGTATGAPGTYKIVIHADNGVSNPAVKNITITVGGIAPKFTSAKKVTLPIGTPATFAITTTAQPMATLNQAGQLPTGMSFLDNGDGAAIITGTPTTSGTYKITVHASNGVGPPRTQTITLIVPRG